MLPMLFALGLAGAAAAAAAAPQTVVSAYVLDRCAPPQGCLPARVAIRMRQEAERIWSSLDVAISWIDSVGSRPDGSHALIVMLEPDTRPASERVLVLGSLYPAAQPGDWEVARLWVNHIRRFAAAARPGGHAFESLPDTLADALVGRALGRALAHEIGHSLLGMAAHSPRGLMRAAFGPRELLEDATAALYGLDARQRATLASSCAALRSGNPASRETRW